MNCEYIAHLRFVSVVGCILAGMWGLFFMANTMNEAKRGYFPAPSGSLGVGSALVSRHGERSTPVEFSSTELPHDVAD